MAHAEEEGKPFGLTKGFFLSTSSEIIPGQSLVIISKHSALIGWHTISLCRTWEVLREKVFFGHVLLSRSSRWSCFLSDGTCRQSSVFSDLRMQLLKHFPGPFFSPAFSFNALRSPEAILQRSARLSRLGFQYSDARRSQYTDF